MKNHLIAGLFILAVTCPAVQAKVSDFPEIPTQKTLDLSLNTEFYQSVSNYTSLGIWKALPTKAYFRYVAVQPQLTYFLLRWLSVNAGLQGLWVEGFSGTPPAQSRFLINFYEGGLAFHPINMESIYLSIGLKGGGPVSQLQENNDGLIVGCGCYFLEPDLWLIYNVRSLVYLFYRSRLRYRFHAISSLWFHKAGAYFRTRHINFGLSANFFFPAFRDPKSNQVQQREVLLKRVNAGSLKFYSVNPSALSFTGWMDFRFKALAPVSLTLYGNVDTYGQSYARGLTLGLSTKLSFSMESESSSYKHYEHLKPPSDTDESDYFEEDESEKNPSKEEPSKDTEYFPEEEDSQDSEYFPEEEDSEKTESHRIKEDNFRKKQRPRRRKRRSQNSSLNQELKKEIYRLRR